MAPIRQLAPAVAARIAAGEVVERPSSVVKELVENAVDAGARRVAVEIAGGGVGLVRVSDDGHGIPPAELGLAFERHATSKLRSDDDLERVLTLGFRGEALPSIAAVADVDCVSRTAEEAHAWALCLRRGVAGPPAPATRTVGTTVTVRELFGELPARRKYLRGRSGEVGQIGILLSALALAYPEVAWSLTVDGRPALETTGGGLMATVEAVHGRTPAAQIVPIEPDPEAGDGDIVVRGCLGGAEASLPTRAGITLLVNRRWVQHRGLGYALDEVYRTLLPIGRHPIAVLDVRLPPGEVDVNVHPRKSEVRFVRERAVFRAVQRAVRRTLARAAGPHGPEDWSGDGEDGQARADGWTTGLRILGQAGGTYIIAEGAAGVYLVDQHAAHERVLYEALVKTYGGRRETQALLDPIVLELAPREATILGDPDGLAALDGLGYGVEPFGERALLVRQVPAALAARDPLGTLMATLAALAEESAAPNWRERLAILFACHNAIRAGDRLAPDEMAALLEQLGEAELCGTCSHGRPTAILLSHHRLAHEFGRDY